MDNSLSTDVIYIDFSRAFDTIVFSKLLYKLQRYGISGCLLNWISGFLHNRTQSVVIDYCSSSTRPVLSGVPQGSVLGPILFLIFINDITCIINNLANLRLFADDVKLYTSILCDKSAEAIQACLNFIYDWSILWQMRINVLKCLVLTICKMQSSYVLYSYFINGQAIPRVNSARDLGITVTGDLQFNSHINTIVTRARQRISVLFRAFTSRNIQLMCKAYITYIRPLVEYNSIVWNPSQIHLIDLLENVQRKFTKRIPSISHLNYVERLKIINLESLELRRLKFDLINYYKFMVLPFNPELRQRFKFYIPPASSRSVYMDQQEKKKRSCNVIVTGLSQVPTADDKSVFGGMILQEMKKQVTVKYCKRIGNVNSNNRPQKLLVTLSNEDDARYLINNAKLLRKSKVEYVRTSVFINPDMTPAEAQAAYECRCARRQRKTTAAATVNHSSASHSADQQSISSNSQDIGASAGVQLLPPHQSLVNAQSIAQ